MTTIFYMIFGSARRAPDGTWIYHRDPFFVFLVFIPVLLGSLAGFQALVELVMGTWGWVLACIMVMGMSFGWALHAFRAFFALVPAPDMMVRQILGTPRCFRGCKVFVSPFFRTKTIVFPGGLDISEGEADPSALGNSTFPIESMVNQDTGGFERQRFIIQTISSLAVDTKPGLVVKQFYDEFAPGSLERQTGTWGERIRKCMTDGWKKVRGQIRQVVASRADEVLSDGTKWTIEKMMTNRAALNKDLKNLLQQPLLDDLGVELAAMTVPDIQDVVAVGWIGNNTQIITARNRSTADQEIAKADQAAQLVQAQSYEVSETAKLKAEEAVAKQRVDTAKQQAAAALEVAKIELQQVVARLEILTSDEKHQMVLNSLLLKFDQLQPADITALASAVTQAFGKPPETVVSVGSSLIEAHSITAFAAAVQKLLPQFFKP